VVLIGCAHTPDLPLRPDPTPPAGSTVETFAAPDGTQLLARSWLPAEDVKAAVVIVHGLKDYSARYAGLAARLAGQGYAVYAFDLRGHGRSAGPRVAPDDWNDYVKDLDVFLGLVESRQRGKPVFLFGHSMGGAIAARAAETHRPIVDGLVLSGPAIAIDAPPLLIAATRLTGFLMPKAPALKLDDHAFSSDPAMAAAIAKDPLISDSAAPASTAAGLVAGMRAIWADIGHLTMPLLALHGSADQLTAPSGSRALIAAAPASDKQLRIYDGFFHDLLHEPGGKGKRVEDDIVAWLDGHTGGAAVPVPAPYTAHLAGDPVGWTQAVRTVAGIGRSTTNPDRTVGFAGRLAVDVARPAPLGFSGSFTAHIVQGQWAVSLRPIGVAYRYAGTAVGVSGGGSLITGTTLALSGGAWFEQEIPVLGHASAFAQIDRRHNNAELVGWSLRLGEDQRYWPHAKAGVGPVISAGGEHVGTWGWFFVAGLELFGAD
jgi:alpha-beta hydrolase superfamily lysophospholipase